MMSLDHGHMSMKVALVFITITLQWLGLQASGVSIDQNFALSQQSLSNNVNNDSQTVHSNSSIETISSSSPAITINQHQQLPPQQQHYLPELVKHDNRRPIWALAHMVNSIKELDYRLSKGANAVEVDVTFGQNGDPLYTYHGPPCDCWRHCHQQEDFKEYLNYVREIAIDMPNGIGQNLSLLFLDLKLDPLSQGAKARAGQELAKLIMSNLFVLGAKLSDNQMNASAAAAAVQVKETAPIMQPQSVSNQFLQPTSHFKLIMSVNHVSDIDLINNFIHTLEINNSSNLMEHIGFDVGMNDDLQLIEQMWRKFGNTLNIWQGDGYTNCFSPFYNLERLSKALTKRDNPLGYPAKVYHWTIDLHDRMRESLLLGVDAIMTNHPERLLAVLQEPEIAHDFRLASRDDNPFRKLTRRLVGRSSETARYQRSAHSNTGGFMGNFVDIFASWLAYIREIPFLSFPTTLMSSRTSQSRSRASGNTGKTGVTLVKIQNQPVYKIENVSSFVSPTSIDKQTVSLSDSLDRSIVQPYDTIGGDIKQEPADMYDGPKWYVSLISNMLLSAMKVILPT